MQNDREKQENGAGETKGVALLLAAVFLVHLLFVNSHPIYLDEMLYAKMALEQQAHPSLVPTFLGYQVGWKPPFFFWVEGAAVMLTSAITDNVDLIYRLPNIIFGVANVFLIYLLFKRKMDKNHAYWGAAMYGFSALFIYTNERVLLDPLTMCFVLGAVYFYTGKSREGGETIRRFALAGLLTLLAFLTKSIVAFVIPAVAAAHILQNERKTLLQPIFLLSFASIPIALAMHYFSLPPGMANDIFFIDMMGKVGSGSGYLEKIAASISNSFGFLNILAISAAIGFAKFWKLDWGMCAWFLLLVFPLLGANDMPWYYYMMLPPFAYFSILAFAGEPIRKKEDAEAFMKLLVGVAIALNLAIAGWWFWHEIGGEERTLGKMLVGKGDVAIIGNYWPSSIVLAYKMLGEQAKFGSVADFGWVIVPREGINESVIGEFMRNYSTSKYPLQSENFARLFWVNEIFRKNTSITRFNYLVVNGRAKPEVECFERVFESADSALYVRTCG